MITNLSVDAFMARMRKQVNPFILKPCGLFCNLFLLFFIALGIWFIRHQKSELLNVGQSLVSANLDWVLIGLVLTVIYVLFQGLMYVFSFMATGHKVSLADSIILFIKRNFISVFYRQGAYLNM